MIREIHIYGNVVSVGSKLEGKAQHLGLGKTLIDKAKQISTELGYQKMAVISAIGTREYYRKRGFEDGALYQFLKF
jgi:elongator complex protein 3